MKPFMILSKHFSLTHFPKQIQMLENEEYVFHESVISETNQALFFPRIVMNQLPVSLSHTQLIWVIRQQQRRDQND